MGGNESDYRFLYNREKLFRKMKSVDVNFKEATLPEILDKVLAKIWYKMLEGGLVAISESTADITVTGKVTAENGTELPGVSIQLKVDQPRTTTDVDGNFK